MASDARRLPTEMAHVLYLDLVAFTQRAMEEQAQHLDELQQVIASSAEYQNASLRGDLIARDTGDGLVLVFFRDPLSPVQCAVEIARMLRSRPHIGLRMGINSGPVSRREDMQGKANVTGHGINMAQRVMDCGDSGHILLSHTSAEVIGQYAAWKPHLRDLGECGVKHGMRVHLFNLYNGEVGNPIVPQRIRDTAASEGPAAAVPAAGSPRVALLYRRGVPRDEAVVRLLERELAGVGFDVFLDRHIGIGVEWAEEIDRKIREASAVIPVLSPESIQSEMLEYEVLAAYHASQAHDGVPRILPVRIGFTDPLTGPMSAILDSLQYFLWQGHEDDEALIERLVDALQRESAVTAPTPIVRESVTGAVPLNSRYYIERPTDEEFRSAVRRGDSIVLVKGARQMGKTSLLARGLQFAREAGANVVLTDLQMLNEAHLASPDALFLTLATAVAGQLDMDVSPRGNWDPDLGANLNLEWFIRRQVLGKVGGHVIWGLDEVDRLFGCSFGSEVFGLFRSWHNRRSLDPSGPWSRLTLAIAYATEAHLFITDLNQSPFNVGTRIALDDFTHEQVAELNRRYGSPLRSHEELTRFYRLVSGQPYLVRRGLDTLVARRIGITALEAEADADDGLFGDHLRRILITLSREPRLLEVVRTVLRGQPCPTQEEFYRLRSTGVLVGDSYRDARLRCHVYATYLARHLL